MNAIHPVEREIAVRFDSVSFSYGEMKVLEKVSFHIHRGEFIALVGSNGSGKTTILKLLLGLEQPSAGKIELFGVPNTRGAAGLHGRAFPPGGADLRGRIGYVPQQPPADQSFPIVVRDVVRMGRLRPLRGYAADAAAAAGEALEQAGIADLANRSYRALSGGQRRRVLIARALAAGPEILILDEPTANMDSESEARLFETLGRLKAAGTGMPSDAAGRAARPDRAAPPQRGITILIVTHDIDFVSALTDRVLCLGDDAEHPYGIVQHRTAAAEGREDCHHAAASRSVRVLHGKNIPADDCYE
ncbi:MAG: metal ABC transporter ATP-binding protein [Treponema sp.]|jgi:zinc transport system ATP-binding protein|nr:metal ABC transporter ATP-binding protein [Treponema sp.]